MSRKFLEPYRAWDGTPMIYYKIMLYFGVPISLVSGLVELVTTMPTAGYLADTEFAWVGWSGILLMVSQLALFTVIFVGLLRRKRYGIVTLLAFYPFSVLYQIYIIIVADFIGSNGPEVGAAMGGIATALIFFPIAFIYYWKRRFLFPRRIEHGYAPGAAAELEMKRAENTEDCVELLLKIQEETERKPVEAQTVEPEAPPKKGKKTHTVLIGALFCVLAATVAIMGVKIREDSLEISALEADAVKLKYHIARSDDEIRWANGAVKSMEAELHLEGNKLGVHQESIGFIVDGSGYYHKLRCDVFQQAEEYSAHDVETCKRYGYEECPDCWVRVTDRLRNADGRAD